MRRYSRKKNSTKIFVAATLVAAVVFGASHYLLNKRSAGAVIAKVNDEKIYQSEIELKLRNIFDSQNQEATLPEIATLPTEVIEILAKEIYLDKKLTEKAKKSEVARNNELQDRINEIKDRLLRQAYIDSLIKTEITDQKINDKYAQLSNDLAGKKEYLISHIVVKNKEEAEKISRELKAKKPLRFSDAAKKFSLDQESAGKGGELGYVLEDNMIKEIADVLPILKKDEVSAPIQTKFGWHLVKFSDIRDAKALPFESVKENIREQLTQDKLNEINSEITKDAKVQILIELKTPEQKAAEGAAAEQPAQATEQSAETATEGDVAAPQQTSENQEVKVEELKSETAQEETKAEEKVAEKSQEKTDAKTKHKKAKHKKHKS